ncbi:MAG: hypothetical protein NT120_00430 [Candidatus Aenigmarchaeota archaeon]|nr:hypothetical protein [Candidatus Aenigmarchaeota archaeon]
MRDARAKMKIAWRYYYKLSEAEDKGDLEGYSDAVQAIIPIAYSVLDVVHTQILTRLKKDKTEEGKLKEREFQKWWEKESSKIWSRHKYIIRKRIFNIHLGHESMSEGKQRHIVRTITVNMNGIAVTDHHRTGTYRKQPQEKDMNKTHVFNIFYFDDKKDKRATNIIHMFLIDLDIMEVKSKKFFE